MGYFQVVLHILHAGDFFGQVFRPPLGLLAFGMPFQNHFAVSDLDVDVRSIYIGVIAQPVANVFADAFIGAAIALRPFAPVGFFVAFIAIVLAKPGSYFIGGTLPERAVVPSAVPVAPVSVTGSAPVRFVAVRNTVAGGATKAAVVAASPIGPAIIIIEIPVAAVGGSLLFVVRIAGIIRAVAIVLALPIFVGTVAIRNPLFSLAVAVVVVIGVVPVLIPAPVVVTGVGVVAGYVLTAILFPVLTIITGAAIGVIFVVFPVPVIAVMPVFVVVCHIKGF